jgi:hypothetical protein
VVKMFDRFEGEVGKERRFYTLPGTATKRLSRLPTFPQWGGWRSPYRAGCGCGEGWFRAATKSLTSENETVNLYSYHLPKTGSRRQKYARRGKAAVISSRCGSFFWDRKSPRNSPRGSWLPAHFTNSRVGNEGD